MEEKKIEISVRNHTKTRLATTIQFGSARNGVNWEIDGFQTFKEKSHNMWTYDVEESNYFKLMKSQSYDAYLKYIEAIAKKFCQQMRIYDKIDILTVEFIDNKVVWK